MKFPFPITAQMACVLAECEHSTKPFHERDCRYTEYEIVTKALQELYDDFYVALNGCCQAKPKNRVIHLFGTQAQKRAITIMGLYLESLGYKVQQGTREAVMNLTKEKRVYVTLDVSF